MLEAGYSLSHTHTLSRSRALALSLSLCTLLLPLSLAQGQAESEAMVVVAYAGPESPAAALRNALAGLLYLLTDIHSLFVNKRLVLILKQVHRTAQPAQS